MGLFFQQHNKFKSKGAEVLRDNLQSSRSSFQRERTSLEAVIYQQDPFIYGCIDYNYTTDLGVEEKVNVDQQSAIARNTPEGRPKRRRSKPSKNKEELETQRMTHIVVERNRHRQMNDYLAVLFSLMPPSYAQRGDQASIVGAAINFVKELEHQVQFMEAYKFRDGQQVRAVSTSSDIFSNFFTFPQYSRPSSIAMNVAVERHSSIADIEVTKVESHASIKIQAKRKPKQLLKMVAGFQSICLNITHLNITTVDQSVLYSFSVKVEDECQLSKVNEIATAVHEMIGRIHNESTSIA
ncbi:transcription factor bHLH96-like [Salvia splendens]|uniref:transcription factor bHLH96-like n=1 Tax=Salvia splendens TaxID=180675 RepID=UPI001C27DEFB|nr:transcription factor bHLH96-like [Salvia splendens]